MNELNYKKRAFQDYLFQNGLNSQYVLLEDTDSQVTFACEEDLYGITIRQLVIFTEGTSIIAHYFLGLINKENKYQIYEVLNELNQQLLLRFCIQEEKQLVAVTHFYSEVGKFDIELFGKRFIADIEQISTNALPKILDELNK